MEKHEVTEVIACLPQEKTQYRYFKDYFALQLLGYLAGDDGIRIDQVRRTPFARLLNKPVIRPLLAMCGDGNIDSWRINAQWQEPSLPFLLTLGIWGGEDDWSWQQTSRPGFNLVLRLNFTRAHDSRFEHLSRVLDYNSFNQYYSHPVMKQQERPYFRETLAWARMDVDFNSGEALIEEIQTDWVREAFDVYQELVSDDPEQADAETKALQTYMDAVLKPYARLWDQAMLNAAIFFIRKELGLHNIFYHTWDSGNAFKGIDSRWCAPPRSLYTSLPKQFCFQPTETVPQFLRGKKAQKRLRKTGVKPQFFQLLL